MSWMSQNYHKAALGGGALVLAGLGYLGFSSSKAAEENLQFSAKGIKNDSEVPGKKKAEDYTKRVKTFEAWMPHEIDGRILNLLTSVDLFVRKGELNDAIDLLEQPPVHPPYGNELFVKNNIDPGYSDSPDRDHDGDGYSNAEEFDAKTNPADVKSYPALVHKLEVAKIETTKWVGILNSAFGNSDVQVKLLGVNPNGRRFNNKMKATDNLNVGGLFFSKAPFQNRFKLLEIKERPKTKGGVETMEKYGVVEDQKANKAKTKYNFFYRLKGKDLVENQQYDDIVHFRLNALGQAGTIYKVETNTSFKVKADGKTLTYKLLEVKRGDDLNPTVAVVEYTKEDGSKGTRNVPAK